jgi:hypothetical protein
MASENPQTYADLLGCEPNVITLNHHLTTLKPERVERLFASMKAVK